MTTIPRPSKLRPPSAIAKAASSIKKPATPLASVGNKLPRPAGAGVTGVVSAIGKKSPNEEVNAVKSKRSADEDLPTLTFAMDDPLRQFPKRAKWDVKLRLEDMESAYAVMKGRVTEAVGVIGKLTLIAGEENQRSKEATDNIDTANKRIVLLEESEKQSADRIQQLNHDSATWREQMDELKSKMSNLQEILANEIKDKEAYIKRCEKQERHIGHLEARTVELSTRQKELEHIIAIKNEEIESTNLRAQEEIERNTLLYEKLRKEETIRRQLHNTIQELKGNIRVFCRIRPTLSTEKSAATPFTFPDEDNKELVIPQRFESAMGKVEDKSHNFAFDHVFKPNNTQENIFEEISQLIQSALDGYSACIFAYGQSGAGKTYTMEGRDGQDAGVIPRTLVQIFESAANLSQRGWTYEYEAQFVEIYNETVLDLLGAGRNDPVKHEIKHDKDGNTYMTDVISLPITSIYDAHDLVERGNKARSTGATNLNTRSSRSHSVLIIKIRGTNSVTGEIATSKLNLVDLAGSERIETSGSTSGDRLKEAISINKSLSALSDVLTSLENENGHRPYRNSKLTYLLQDSLGGNSKVLMFVNVSPLQCHLSETLTSLRFASKVNNVRVGTAKSSKR